MNWMKLIGNIGGVAALCFGGHAAMAGAEAAATSVATWFGIGLCIASNLAGLFQQPPHQTGAP